MTVGSRHDTPTWPRFGANMTVSTMCTCNLEGNGTPCDNICNLWNYHTEAKAKIDRPNYSQLIACWCSVQCHGRLLLSILIKSSRLHARPKLPICYFRPSDIKIYCMQFYTDFVDTTRTDTIHTTNTNSCWFTFWVDVSIRL